MTVRVIAFDLDDTLWPVKPVITGAEKALNRWLGGSIRDWPAAARNMGAIRDQLLIRDPTLSYQLTELRCKCITEALDRHGKSNARQIAEEAMEVFLHARHDVEYFDGAEECLADLSTRFVLGALSNGNADVRDSPSHRTSVFHFRPKTSAHPSPHPICLRQPWRKLGFRPVKSYM